MFRAILHSLLLISLCALTLTISLDWQLQGEVSQRYAIGLYLLFVVEYLLILRTFARSEDLKPVGTLIAASIVGRAVLACAPVMLSGDLPRYLWEGFLVREGINPFFFAPEHPALESLRTAYWSEIEYPHLAAIYPPVAQYFLALFAYSTVGWKLFLVLVESLNVYLLTRLLKAFSIPRGMALVYACLPLAMLETCLSGHLEALLVTFLLSFFLYIRTLELRAFFVYDDTIRVHCLLALALIVAAGILTKYVMALPLAVFLLVRGRHFGIKRLMFFSLALVFLLLLFSAPFLKVSGRPVPIFQTLGVYLDHWRFNDSALHLLGWIAGADWGHLESFWHFKAALSLIWMVAMGLLLRTAKSSIRPTMLGFALFLFCGAVFHPWYGLWFAPLLAVSFSPALLYLLLALPLAYAPKIAGTAGDVPTLIKVIEYVPVILIALYSFRFTGLPIERRFTNS